MKTRTEKLPAPATFEPFELVITIESEEELVELWHRFNVNYNSNYKWYDFKKGPRCGFLVWKTLDKQATKLGVAVGVEEAAL
ncbi:hypothetical protein [Desulfovibrio oxyclinae]|uniref:hypothetical protein n=1 Tax=Desulfovibrio oxyclinae TaxID=63560 RepID=UPI0003631062|nr:hypothetical protein [Desulfovibrio oxyclinae]